MKIVTQIASFLIKFVGDVLLEIVAQIASFLIVFVGEMPLEIVAKIASFLTDRSNRPILSTYMYLKWAYLTDQLQNWRLLKFLAKH